MSKIPREDSVYNAYIYIFKKLSISLSQGVKKLLGLLDMVKQTDPQSR
jgi:hypothetical protein